MNRRERPNAIISSEHRMRRSFPTDDEYIHSRAELKSQKSDIDKLQRDEICLLEGYLRKLVVTIETNVVRPHILTAKGTYMSGWLAFSATLLVEPTMPPTYTHPHTLRTVDK